MGPVVLGLCSGTHDSAAALIADGALVGLVEEERLNGDKHTKAYPERSVAWLLEAAGLRPEDVTDVAYNFAPRLYLNGAVPLRHLRPGTAGRALPRARSFLTVNRRASQRLRAFGRHFPNAALHGVEHHRAHGMYAFTASPFERAAVLVVDSLGETTTTSVSVPAAAPGQESACTAGGRSRTRRPSATRTGRSPNTWGGDAATRRAR